LTNKTNKQTIKQAKQTSKTNKETKKQRNKETNKETKKQTKKQTTKPFGPRALPRRNRPRELNVLRKLRRLRGSCVRFFARLVVSWFVCSIPLGKEFSAHEVHGQHRAGRVKLLRIRIGVKA
jgi:hypothetical protein